MNIDVVGVVGAGQMGRNVAPMLAEAGLRVLLHDLHVKILEEAMGEITKRLNEAIRKKELTEWVREKILKNIKTITRLEDLGSVDLLLEAVPEREEIKAEVFETLDAVCHPDVLFATTTASISVTRLASLVRQPERFIGIHFVYPADSTPIVEVVRGLRTSDETVSRTKQLIEKLGKRVIFPKDFPGFVISRILLTMMNEAVFAVMEGVGSVAMVDEAVKIGAGMTVGPLLLADQIGLDTCLDILEVLYTDFGDSKYRPCPLLRKYVEAGYLGQKTGQGFYNYSAAPEKNKKPIYSV